MATCLYCSTPVAAGEDLCHPCLARWASENGIDLVRRALSRENDRLRAEVEQLREQLALNSRPRSPQAV